MFWPRISLRRHRDNLMPIEEKKQSAEHRIAVFPGTFDPVTNGHLDIIRRGAALFDRLVIGIGDNPEKDPLFSLEKRLETMREAIADIERVTVKSYTGLTVDFAASENASVILRGIRDSGDFHFESRSAVTNRELADIETLFMITSGRYSHISSTLIRQVIAEGGEIAPFVPPAVLRHL